jgi:hypothetical protein
VGQQQGGGWAAAAEREFAVGDAHSWAVAVCARLVIATIKSTAARAPRAGAIGVRLEVAGSRRRSAGPPDAGRLRWCCSTAIR